MSSPALAPTDAVILMAGAGSRLGPASGALAKPLVPIAGRPLIAHTLDPLAALGVRTLHIITGANGSQLAQEIARLLPEKMALNAIANPAWEKQNGVSVLCAQGAVRAPFFLAMGDHLFDAAVFHRLLQGAEPAQLNLAIDRKVAAVFDLDDAMKVVTRDEQVVEIGKTLPVYDAIDTGLFLCPDELFDYLRRAQRAGDCSLADGVRLMAADRKVRAVDIGAAWWQDVDTPEMYAQAEAHFRVRQSAR